MPSHIRHIDVRFIMQERMLFIGSLTSPALTVVPQRMRAPYSSLGYLRGSGSPVIDAVSIDRMSPTRNKSSKEVTQLVFKSKYHMQYKGTSNNKERNISMTIGMSDKV